MSECINLKRRKNVFPSWNEEMDLIYRPFNEESDNRVGIEIRVELTLALVYLSSTHRGYR